MTAQFVPDLALMQILFEAAELSPDLIPPEIDGQPFTVTLSTSVMQLWEDNALMTLQMESPTVEFPDAVDEEALGIAMLQFLGYSPADAAALSASIDWTTTLLLPLPSDLVNFESVVVDGTDGFYLTGASPEGEFEDYAAVLWQKDGFVYLVARRAESDQSAGDCQFVAIAYRSNYTEGWVAITATHLFCLCR